jgi:hypothetical protein
MVVAVQSRIGDPNFPQGGLSITPSHSKYTTNGYKDQQVDIEEYGIAGKTWEAAYLLTQYLSRPSSGGLVFDPPCSLLSGDKEEICVVELGAGVGVAGIHLAQELAKGSSPSASTDQIAYQVILTDLGNVLPLLERNVSQANLDRTSVKVRALPWGSDQDADTILQELSPRRLTHIICSDLVYFPELLCPLLRSLIYLTNTSTSIEVIIGYKLRSHSKEEPFWKAFGVWFNFAPILCKDLNKKDEDWRRFGNRSCDSGRAGSRQDEDAPAEDEMFVFVAQRKKSTLECLAPENDDQLLSGYLIKNGILEQGSGAETFELLLMNAIED